ncbi:hypothetical protein ACGF0K_36280 [Streptomyces sp. NPDC048156]|uniref:hypothetical protein n=1 Tax=Streptomyces sp. NPDC048156 TaxID=3365502 RepID=UPI003718D00A
MYTCAVCIAELDYKVRDEQRRIDLGETPTQPDSPPRLNPPPHDPTEPNENFGVSE